MSQLVWQKWLAMGLVTSVMLGCGSSGSDVNTPALDSVDPMDNTPPPPDTPAATPGATVEEVVSPPAGALLTAPPEQFELSFDGGIPANLSIELNNRDVTELFDISEQGATLAGEQLTAFLQQGRNTLEARSESISFTYDTEPPRIVINAVTEVNGDGDPPGPGSTLQVSGRLVDPSPIAGFTINDQSIAVTTSKQFSAEIPYADLYTLIATDAEGFSSSLQIVPPGHSFDPSLAIQANGTLFDFAIPLIEGLITDFDASTLIDPATPVVTYTEGCGLNSTCDLFLTQLALNGEPTIDLQILPNDPTQTDRIVLEIAAELPNIMAGIDLRSSGWFSSEFPVLLADISLNDLTANIRISLTTDENNQLVLDFPGEDAISITIGSVQESNVDALCSALGCLPLGGLAELLLNTLREGSLFADSINGLLSGLLGPLIADIDIPNIPANLQVDIGADGTNEIDLGIGIAPSVLTSDGDGNGYVELAGNIFANEIGEDFPGALGSVFRAGALPTFASTTPAGDEYDLGIALPVNLLNQAFLTISQTGLLNDLDITITLDSLGGFGNLLRIIGINEGDQFIIGLDLGAVPYMQLAHGEAAGILMFIDQASIQIEYNPISEERESLLLAGLVMDIQANVEVGIDEENKLDLGVENLLSLQVLDIDSDIGLLTLISPEFLTNQISGLLDNVLSGDALDVGGLLGNITDLTDQLAGALDGMDIGIDVPAFGVIVRQLEVDENEAHLILTVDLLSEADLEDNDDPLTFLLDLSGDDEEGGEATSEALGQGVQTAAITTAVFGRSEVISLASPGNEQVQYRYRIDGGRWSVWKVRDAIQVYGLPEGAHDIEVCARRDTIQAAGCETLPFVVDY